MKIIFTYFTVLKQNTLALVNWYFFESIVPTSMNHESASLIFQLITSFAAGMQIVIKVCTLTNPFPTLLLVVTACQPTQFNRCERMENAVQGKNTDGHIHTPHE